MLEDRARAILSGLGVSIVDEAPGVFRCTPPGHRPDLAIEEDLIEELMRVYGLEAMPAQATVPSAPIDERRDARFELRDRVIDGLRAGGLRELVSYAFTSAEKLDPVADGIPAERRVIVQNPLRSQHGIMRTNLLAGLLDCLEANASRHPRPIKVFEVGRIYAWPAGAREHAGPTAAVDRLLPDERLQAALLLYGGATGRGELDGAPIDAHLAGGLLLHALAQLGFTAQLAPMTSLIPYLHPGVQAAVVIAGVGEVGHFGEVHPDLLATRELPAGCRAYHGWLDLEALPDLPIRRHGSIPRFPETSRDLSLELPITVPAADVVEALEVGATAILEALEGDDPIRLVGAGAAAQAIEVLEDYRGKGIPDGRRALLLRLHYGAAGRSVTDAEAQVVHQQIVERAQRSLAEGHRAEVRVR
ncbi:MAG: hypothetical protein R3A51_21965 [Nannocystaceae bacterium]